MSFAGPQGGGQPAGPAAAPAAPPEAGGGDPGADQGGDEGAAPNLDPKVAQYLQGLQQQVGEFQGRFEQTNQQLQQQQELMRRASRVLSGQPEDGSDQEPDFDALDQQALDEYLEAALENKTAGGPGLPLTVKLKLENVQQSKQIREQGKVLAQLKQQLEMLTNPNAQADNLTYLSLDRELQQSIINLYGQPDPQVKQAVATKISEQIRTLQKDRPDVWDAIRNSQEYQRRLVLGCMDLVIPTRAREMLRREQVQNTPMSVPELYQAFREANDKIQNPSERIRVKEMIRRQILEQTMGGGGRPMARRR